MPAFNQRIVPFRWLGLPGYAVIAGVAALAASMLALTFPIFLFQLLFGLIAVVAVLALIASIVLGDKIMFSSLLLDNWFDRLARPTIKDSE